jgi:hypothetical protein
MWPTQCVKGSICGGIGPLKARDGGGGWCSGGDPSEGEEGANWLAAIQAAGAAWGDARTCQSGCKSTVFSGSKTFLGWVSMRDGARPKHTARFAAREQCGAVHD